MTSDVNFSLDDPPEAYSNATVHSRLSDYTEMARELHGPEFDPATEDISGEVVMRMEGGKWHGRVPLDDGILDTASTPTLSQIRASGSGPAIRPRTDASHHHIQALQVIFLSFIIHYVLHTLSFELKHWCQIL